MLDLALDLGIPIGPGQAQTATESLFKIGILVATYFSFQ